MLKKNIKGGKKRGKKKLVYKPFDVESLSDSTIKKIVNEDNFKILLEKKANEANKNKINYNNLVNVSNNISKDALEEYADLQIKFIKIFEKVCDQREIEHRLAENAKKSTIEMIKTLNYNKNEAENIAFKNLRNKKNKNRNKKIDLHIELAELSNDLESLFGKKGSGYAKRRLKQSELFKQFIKKNPKCKKLMKWGHQKDIGNYEGLSEYLGSATKRIVNKNE